ncbi:MAG: tRNA-dihydrouridine synthase family protein [Nannocystaceae bacterium]|nr:tRNA-dihydrouridine synthase family protein [Nannocystaceae bacterium]
MNPTPRPRGRGLALALAPMDGITDAAWRELATGVGDDDSGIDWCVSEFVRVTHCGVGAAVLLREVPELAHGGRTRSGVPVAVQLLGGVPGPMADTAARAVELGALAIDLNFGCPAKTVNNHDGGAALLKTPCRIESVVAAVRAAVPPQIPVSAKIRLGWDSSATVVELARAAEAGGAAWLTIHARTRLQLYAPPVDWGAIGRARAAVGIDVVANGDLCRVADVERCAADSGCSAFMIGRAAMADPWLFRRIRGLQPDGEVDAVALTRLVEGYVANLRARGGTESMALARVKQWMRFAAALHEPGARAFEAIKRCSSLAQAQPLLAAALASPEGVSSPGRRAAGPHPAASSSHPASCPA